MCGGRQLLARRSGQVFEQLNAQQKAAQDRKHQAGTIEQAHGNACGRGAHIQVDQCLFPTALEEQPGGEQHDQVSQGQQVSGDFGRDTAGQDIDADMTALMQHDLRAGEDQPDECQPGNFFAEEQTGVEAITQNDVGEDQPGDAHQAGHDQCFEGQEIEIQE
jgi:hypothetical protein